MNEPFVLFSHGKESGPGGRKITMLAEIARRRGLGVESIDYRDLASPEDRTARLESRAREVTSPLVLVGSSMGGYVSALAASRLPTAGLFLMAPAIGISGYAHPTPEARAGVTFVVGAWGDDIIAPTSVFAFAQKTSAELLFLDTNHRLDSHLPAVARFFETFLERVLASRWQPTPAEARNAV